jgi:hypothetical protein
MEEEAIRWEDSDGVMVGEFRMLGFGPSCAQSDIDSLVGSHMRECAVIESPSLLRCRP